MNERAATTHSGDRLMMLVVVTCAAMLPLSILEAGWAPRSGELLFVCLLGLACGALIGPLELARAVRWPIVTVAALALAMSNAGLFNVSVQAARIRIVTWGTELLAGRTVQDPGLVTLWTTLLIWWASYSAVHGIASSGRALEALLPTAIPLTINLIYTRLSLLYIVVIVSGLVILMARTAQGKHETSWAARRLDYPDLRLEWMSSGLLTAVIVCTLAMLFTFLTSQTTVGWMGRAFDWPASQVRQIATRFLGGARPVAHDEPGLGGAAILPTSRLITDPPQLLGQVVMWVWTDEPPPEESPAPHGNASKPGWRGLTYAIYNGRGWSNPPLTSRPFSSTLSGDLTQRFEIVALHGDTLFAASQPVSSDAGLTALYRSGWDADLIGLRGAMSQYTVTSSLVLAAEDALRQSPVSYSPEITPYLQLPTTVSGRVRGLAREITRGTATPYDKAVKIEAFLRTYPYTLDLPPLPEGRDLVDYFLFDAPGGYCDYYASAMVVMLRAVGAPARLASGYTRGTFDYERGAYQVLGTDAHSWPEVYFVGIGWVEFEPTAGRSASVRESFVQGRTAPYAGLSAGQVRAAQIQHERLIGLAWSTIGVALLVTAVIVYWVRRERQLAALPASELIPLLYASLRKRGAWLGVDMHPGDTPDEFVTAFNRTIERRTAQMRWQKHARIVQQAVTRIGDIYCQASYSPRKPDLQEAHRALEAWRGLRLRTWLFRFQMPHIKPQNG